MRNVSYGLAKGLVTVAVCQSSCQSDRVDVGHAMHGLEAQCRPLVDQHTPRACSIVEAQGTIPIRTSALGENQGPNIEPDLKAYGVHLLRSAGPNGGQLSFVAQNSGRYIAYLGTPYIPFEIVEDIASIGPVCTGPVDRTGCAPLRRGFVYDFEAGKTYRLRFGPISPQRWVRLILIDTAFGQSCMPEEPPSFVTACAAGTARPQRLELPPVGEDGPEIFLDTVYGAALFEGEGQNSGSLRFTPSSDGFYTLYLGTPHVPFLVRDVSSGLRHRAECTSQFSGFTCHPLRRAYTYSLKAQTEYRLEFGPTARNRWVRFLATEEVCREAIACEGDQEPKSSADLAVLGRRCSSISGSLIIEGTSLTDLQGLECLRDVTRRLVIRNNHALQSLRGLEQLRNLSATVEIVNNSALSSLHGLDNVSFAEGFKIENNPALTNLRGLQELGMSFFLVIKNNDGLTNLRGLESLVRVEGTVEIRDNDSLIDLSGLRALLDLPFGSLTIANNDALVELAGLESLRFVDLHLSIVENPVLSSLTGLQGLDTIGDGLFIQSNPELRSCEIQSLQAHLGTECNCKDNNDLEVCNTCVVHACNGHGTCDDTAGEVRCTCDPGWDPDTQCATCVDGRFGQNCDESVDCSLAGPCEGDRVVTSTEALLDLRSCRSLSGNLSVHGVESTKLEGLECLRAIDGDFRIFENPSLIELSGPEKSTFLGGALVIDHNPALESLKGLEAFRVIGGLAVRNNLSLLAINGWEELDQLRGDLEVDHNPSMTHISGFTELSRFDGNLQIEANAELQSISEFNALVHIRGDLAITANPMLVDISGLDTLDEVSGAFNITDNSSLAACVPPNLAFQTQKGPHPCFERGVCEDQDGDATCVCEPGWRAETHCATCDDGFHGEICVEDTMCTPNFCNGNGRCQDNSGEATCTCEDGFFGLHCEVTCQDARLCEGDREPQNADDLRALRGCSALTGTLSIRDTELTDLEGLECLQAVQRLTLDRNNALTSLAALENLRTIEGALFITSNPALRRLRGLDRLESIGRLSLQINASLHSIAALRSLQSARGGLIITFNPSLQSLSGLENIANMRSLTVSRNQTLTELTSFRNLQSLTTLRIEDNPSLRTLAGLEAVTLVDGSINIAGNIALTDLRGLSGLGAVTDLLFISRNASLSDLRGLEQLTDIGGSLRLRAQPGLSDLRGLDGLESIGFGLDIESTENLRSLAGLERLTSIGLNLNVARNPNLINLGGLNNLSSIGGSMLIQHNRQLSTLAGLEKLRSIGARVRISNNAELASLEALAALASVEDDLTIENNSSLPACAPEALADRLQTACHCDGNQAEGDCE